MDKLGPGDRHLGLQVLACTAADYRSQVPQWLSRDCRSQNAAVPVAQHCRCVVLPAREIAVL